MKKQFTILLILILCFYLLPIDDLLAYSCNKEGNIITSVSPSNFLPGDTVTIYGSGFGSQSECGPSCASSIYFYNDFIDLEFQFCCANGAEDDYNPDLISWQDNKIELKIPTSDNKHIFHIDNILNGSLDNGLIRISSASVSGWTCGVLDQDTYWELTCSEDIWECEDWTLCSQSGMQNRNCNKIYDCPYINSEAPATFQSCTPCTADIWECSEWSQCSIDGQQARNCNMTFDCPYKQYLLTRNNPILRPRMHRRYLGMRILERMRF